MAVTTVRAPRTDEGAAAGEGVLPAVESARSWTLLIEGHEDAIEAAVDARLTLADTRIGTIGSPPVELPGARYGVLAADVYAGTGPETDLVACPLWSLLPAQAADPPAIRRVLDLRSAILHQELETEGGRLRVAQFSSLARPGVVALRAVGPDALPSPDGPLVAPPERRVARDGRAGLIHWMQVDGDPGGVAAAAVERPIEPESTEAGGSGPVTDAAGAGYALERLGAYVTDRTRRPPVTRALARLERASRVGWDRLLHEHREAWARRWDEADIRIQGDGGIQLAIRFAMFHLIGTVATHGEAAVGARALTGPAYRGHVFWDADVFVLPFFAATHPQAARAMLEYRVRRLDAALEAAREVGRRGAWFPWESAHDGRDVTPTWVVGRDGTSLRVWTGEHEQHIVADVAWAAATYIDWTGDRDFERGSGLRLLVETARYWASRVTVEDDGRGHLRDVVGPDEYHDHVDDNVFTNGMARWNLRRAARLAEELDAVPADERRGWLDLADRIVDGYDEATGRHEQFEGFFRLRPLIISEIRRRPIPADLVLGTGLTSASQIVKQADVLMLHHVAPDEARPASLERDMDYYEPRTSHGSSLSPGVHASLLARLGRTEQALEWLRATAALDLGLGSTEKGVHIAAMGSLWQALVYGFGGIRPVEVDGRGLGLSVDPQLPQDWGRLVIPVSFHGRRLRFAIDHERLRVSASGPTLIAPAGEAPFEVGPGSVELRSVDGRWQAAS